ncbi:hypothetical protein QT970_03510 [Microcoleus sp. herbarium8]|uniref:hypothetical protein n=1 Tax=Microcoleus sp. herbarium8 TaxID=3055436 RepID=UPI002FD5A8FB
MKKYTIICLGTAAVLSVPLIVKASKETAAAPKGKVGSATLVKWFAADNDKAAATAQAAKVASGEAPALPTLDEAKLPSFPEIKNNKAKREWLGTPGALDEIIDIDSATIAANVAAINSGTLLESVTTYANGLNAGKAEWIKTPEFEGVRLKLIGAYGYEIESDDRDGYDVNDIAQELESAGNKAAARKLRKDATKALKKQSEEDEKRGLYVLIPSTSVALRSEIARGSMPYGLDLSKAGLVLVAASEHGAYLYPVNAVTGIKETREIEQIKLPTIDSPETLTQERWEVAEPSLRAIAEAKPGDYLQDFSARIETIDGKTISGSFDGKPMIIEFVGNATFRGVRAPTSLNTKGLILQLVENADGYKLKCRNAQVSF